MWMHCASNYLVEIKRLPAPKISVNSQITDFYDFTPDDIVLEGYEQFRQIGYDRSRIGGYYVSTIVAVAHHRVIGKDNSLIWHLPNDLKFFKEKNDGPRYYYGP